MGWRCAHGKSPRPRNQGRRGFPAEAAPRRSLPSGAGNADASSVKAPPPPGDGRYRMMALVGQGRARDTAKPKPPHNRAARRKLYYPAASPREPQGRASGVLRGAAELAAGRVRHHPRAVSARLRRRWRSTGPPIFRPATRRVKRGTSAVGLRMPTATALAYRNRGVPPKPSTFLWHR